MKWITLKEPMNFSYPLAPVPEEEFRAFEERFKQEFGISYPEHRRVISEWPTKSGFLQYLVEKKKDRASQGGRMTPAEEMKYARFYAMKTRSLQEFQEWVNYTTRLEWMSENAPKPVETLTYVNFMEENNLRNVLIEFDDGKRFYLDSDEENWPHDHVGRVTRYMEIEDA